MAGAAGSYCKLYFVCCFKELSDFIIDNFLQTLRIITFGLYFGLSRHLPKKHNSLQQFTIKNLAQFKCWIAYWVKIYLMYFLLSGFDESLLTLNVGALRK